MEIIGEHVTKVNQPQHLNQAQAADLFPEINRVEEHAMDGQAQQENANAEVNVEQPSIAHENMNIVELTTNLFWEKDITNTLKGGKNILVIIYITTYIPFAIHMFFN